MRARRASMRRTLQSAVGSGLAVLVASCATGLESLPLPRPGQTGPCVLVTAEFANALNLPAGAKVKLNGADIGEVASIRAKDFAADVTLRINADTPLQIGATAELRSATPLGDVFVALHPDPDPAPDARALRSGDVIPVGATGAAATVEDVLASAALLVNGGAVRRLVGVVNGAGSAVGGRGGKIAGLLHESNTLISRLNARSAELDRALRNTSELAATISARQDTLNRAIDAAGPGTDVIEQNTAQMADMVDTIGRITNQLNRFPSLRGTDTRSMIADLNTMSAVLNDISLDPNLSLNSWNRLAGVIMKIASGVSLSANVTVPQLAFGALPDKNYPGDPMFHGADGTDWHAMIASLRYEWNLFLSKVYGPQHEAPK
jgi:virulence factor Mce-like protein